MFTFSRTNRGSAKEAKLQTAVSSGLVNSTISVQRFEDFIVPKFCWLLFLLHASWCQSPNSIIMMSRIECFIIKKKMMGRNEKWPWIICKDFLFQFGLPTLQTKAFVLALPSWPCSAKKEKTHDPKPSKEATKWNIIFPHDLN